MSLRDKLIRIAYNKPELRNKILPLLKEAGDKAKTEEGAKKLFDKYMEGLTPEGRKNTKKKPEDFYEKPAEDSDSGKSDKEEPKKEEKSEKNPYSGMSKKELTEKKKSIGNFEWSKAQAVSQNKKKLEKQKGTIQYLSDVLSGKKKPSGTDFDDNEKRKSKLEKAKEEIKKIESDLKKSEGEYEKASEKAKQIDQALKSLGDASSEKKASLRTQIIRLAHEKPELRTHLLPLLKEGGTEPDLTGEMKSLTEYLAKSLRKFNPGYIDFGHIGMTDGYMFHLDIPFNDHQKSIKLFLGLLKKQVKDIRKAADYSDNYETSIVFESQKLPNGGARTVPLKIQIIMEKEPDRRMEINVYK